MASRRLTVTPKPSPAPEARVTRRQRYAAWFFVIIMLVSALGAVSYMLTQ